MIDQYRVHDISSASIFNFFPNSQDGLQNVIDIP
jgi:hypothetical protein